MQKPLCCQGPFEGPEHTERLNCSSFLNADIRPHRRGQGPFWYERVSAMLLASPAAFEDGCRWNANYPGPRGWTRAQFKGWAGCSRTSKRRDESVPLRGSSTTEGRCLSGDTLSTPFHYMHYTTPPSRVRGCGCICFVSAVKMKSSCPLRPCIRRYFSVCDADLKATLSFLYLYTVSFQKHPSYITSLPNFPARCSSSFRLLVPSSPSS